MFLFQDLFGHIRRGCMRNGIMHMQEIQVIVPDHIHHGTRQGRFIRRKIKQRIGRNPHFVVKYIGAETG